MSFTCTVTVIYKLSPDVKLHCSCKSKLYGRINSDSIKLNDVFTEKHRGLRLNMLFEGRVKTQTY